MEIIVDHEIERGDVGLLSWKIVAKLHNDTQGMTAADVWF